MESTKTNEQGRSLKEIQNEGNTVLYRRKKLTGANFETGGATACRKGRLDHLLNDKLPHQTSLLIPRKPHPRLGGDPGRSAFGLDDLVSLFIIRLGQTPD